MASQGLDLQLSLGSGGMHFVPKLVSTHGNKILFPLAFQVHYLYSSIFPPLFY